MRKIDWDLWGVNKKQRKVFGCGYASNPMDKQPEVIASEAYKKWTSIMFKCKSVVNDNDFTICKEWLDFSKFKEFYNKYNYSLEKESVKLYTSLLDLNNKEYSPENCIFAPNTIGSLLNDTGKNEDEKKYNLPKWVRLNVKEDGRNQGFGGGIIFRFYGNKHRTVTISSKVNAQDAFEECKFLKELSFVHIAYQYRKVIETRLFNAVSRYRINNEGNYYIDDKVSAIKYLGIGYISPCYFDRLSFEDIISESFKMWKDIIYKVYKQEAYICEEWKDYYCFKDWYDRNTYSNIATKHNIFNTLYNKDNIHYSPETTVLLPHNLYILVYNQQRIDLDDREDIVPQGINKTYGKTKVTYKIVPPKIVKSGKSYYANSTSQKSYDTLEEAQIGYKDFRQKYKEKYLKEKGYGNLINQKLYQALLDYEIDIPTVEFEEDEDGEEDYIEC